MKSVFAIGNGVSAGSIKGLGSRIDKFSGDVVRFNRFQTEGFEDVVGSRTDVWITNLTSYPVHGVTVTTRVILTRHDMCREVPVSSQWLSRWREKFPQLEVMSEEFFQRAKTLAEYDYPSTGLTALCWMASCYDRIFLIGFDGHTPGKGHHYFQQGFANRKHFPENESRAIERFVRRYNVCVVREMEDMEQ